MKLSKILFFLFVICSFSMFAQKKYTLSGTVKENSTNETLIGVTIIIPELNTGTTTNEYGFYSITLPEGNYTVQISFVGYQTIEEQVSLTTNQIKNYSLLEQSENLDEVVIEQKVEKTNIRKPQMSVNALSAKTIKKIPVILGEVDVIKAITLLPGVTNAGEGSSGFNVRGGAADQNLILLDEATVFNSSHLFGLFSVFNTDAIKDLKLYKGGIPARYGGRVSSVLDIYQKEGNSNSFHGNGGIGLVSSRLLLEGPIVKEKSSFLLGGRTSYAHFFLPLFDIDNKAYFYDLNTKLSYTIDKKNRLYASGYFGRDVFNLQDSFVNTYGNSIFNLRWNHLFSDKLFSNLSLIYSDYYYGLKFDLVEFNWDSGIKNVNIKYDFKHYLNNKIQLQYGFNGIYYTFNPGYIEPTTETSPIQKRKLIDKYAFEDAFYIDAEHKVTNKLSLSYGLRFSSFFRLGQNSLNYYKDDKAVVFDNELKIYEKATPEGADSFKRKDLIKVFGNFEPRLAMSLQLGKDASIKASYNRVSQYLHLLSNTSSPTPLDVWAPSGKYIKPQLLDQYAFGIFKTFNNNAYSLELESFYKNVKNRIDYIDGAELIANDAIEQVILNGKARAYGLEILAKKNEGKLTGWLAYTLSKSEQLTAGRTPEETGINYGRWYRTPYDKTHDLSFIASYNIGKKWDLNANFIYQTGQPTTYPIAQYVYDGVTVPSFDVRNNNRLPNYHRLDISANFTPKPYKKKGWQASWSFGIYNVYNRKNAASIRFTRNYKEGRNEATRFAIFGIVPSVSYNFKF